MSLSVIVPVRNASKLLDSCLSSFYPLNVSLDRIIVVDCYSSDGIEVVLSKHSSLPIHHVCDRDFGIYDAFNKGVQYSVSKYVFFMGADDLINPEIFRALDDFPSNADVFVGGISRGGLLEFWRPYFLGFHLLFRNVPHQGMLIKRELLLKAPYSLRYPILADYAWNLANFWRKDVVYSYSPKVFCNWAFGGVSQTREDVAFRADKSMLVNSSAPFIIRVLYRAFRLLKFKKD